MLMSVTLDLAISFSDVTVTSASVCMSGLSPLSSDSRGRAKRARQVLIGSFTAFSGLTMVLCRHDKLGGLGRDLYTRLDSSFVIGFAQILSKRKATLSDKKTGPSSFSGALTCGFN